MTNKELIRTTGHRPFPLPNSRWIQKQIWHDLLFAHWPVRADQLMPLLPRGLDLDLWEGEPWISISPFYITGLRLRGLPPLPFTSRFPELNVRTYVTCNGRPGIFFFSLDAGNRIAVEAARVLFRLPYFRANMTVRRTEENVRYFSSRKDSRGQAAMFSATYKAADPHPFHALPDTLLHWLTERYCLYTTDAHGRILEGDIHHLPWQLQKAELRTERNTMTEALGIRLPDVDPLLTFTKRLEVLFWPNRKV
ncbi:DUF2071 domain-containing protein [Cohnella pontilimi]|uniref:DUF2071 domain-containing protein n=1 Tax=Cohnella pontilimi TaxID=2564100 RepID=A0A4U0F8X9_9BACL|nr:DUF2071 domain-containing protein [Cohnella pontilimi]TJY41147.1 DUF2071 domain-containing protein [Cohnella pontilimi]